MKKPRILQILYSGLGGHSAVSTTLVEAGGAADGWRHHLLFYGIEPVAAGYKDSCEKLGVPYDYVEARQGRPWARWHQLMRKVRTIAPDAIILHSIKTILPMSQVARAYPLLAVEHQPNALKSRAEWVASALAQRLADRVITLSPHYHETLRAKLGPLFRETNTVQVPTGIELSPFAGPLRARGSQSPQRPLRIGMAARFTPTKTQEVLVTALAQLRNNHPERDWRLTLAGDGPRHAVVAEAVRGAGLGRFVELPGHIPSERLPEWFASLDFYAQASDGETLSTALMQAMAAGVPIIGSDVAGISDLLGQSQSGTQMRGRLVPGRDARGFAASIAALADDPAATADQVERARDHVINHHSPQAMRAGYAKLLEDLWRVK